MWSTRGSRAMPQAMTCRSDQARPATAADGGGVMDRDVEVLDCYRVVRIAATPDKWEQAIKGYSVEVQDYVRARLADHQRAIKHGEIRPGARCVIVFGEPGYRNGFARSLGRSIEYYVGMFRANGVDLNWQHNGKP